MDVTFTVLSSTAIRSNESNNALRATLRSKICHQFPSICEYTSKGCVCCHACSLESKRLNTLKHFLDHFHQRAVSRVHHKRDLGITRARNRDYEHVAFSFCPTRSVVSQECKIKKCIRTSESSRCAQIKDQGSPLPTRNNPASSANTSSTTSALGRLLTPGAAFATLLLRALLENHFFRTTTTASGFERATCVETRPRNKDATAATCLNFSASRSFCF